MRAIGIIGSFLLSLSAPASAGAAEEPRPPEDRPGLVLDDLEGRPQSLRDLEGSIVLLNFWATWCIPCREEMPIFVSLQNRYADRGVRVIAVSTDGTEKREEVARFARDEQLDFPVWVGGTTADMRRFGLGDALPATAVIDRQGRVVGRILGRVETRDLKRRIEWLLDAPEPLVLTLPGAPGHSEAGEGEDADHDHHEHEGEEHAHGGVGMEGASLVPS